MEREKPEQRMLMGNEAIARGLIENGCTLAASYPGTPASEILASVAAFAKETGTRMHVEWSLNEKVAFETALAHSYTGKRAAVSMKQVGLNVAADPFMRSAYLGVKGGFVVVSADDPGPHSSQTEQDSRLFAHFAKIPIFDPASPREARDMVRRAFELSEKYEIPVMIRPTTRVCHARQNVDLLPITNLARKAVFEKNPSRWAATPQFIPALHRSLNQKIGAIATEAGLAPVRIMTGTAGNRRAVVASGVVFSHTYEILEEMGANTGTDLFQVTLPYPLNRDFVRRLFDEYDSILVLEETYPVIELQLAGRHVQGRYSGLVPLEGELTPDVVQAALHSFLKRSMPEEPVKSATSDKRPSLCPGCSHRSAFYAIKQTFPEGIFPSDIGCYTLGVNLGAVDTCHCMGACISQGAGLYHSFAQDSSPFPTIVVTLGDSTFFHAGIPGLINAGLEKARFILVILDNATTAMTGHQPVPHLGLLADGSMGNAVSIDEVVKASGVRFLEVRDPYGLEEFQKVLKKADEYIRGEGGGVAVIIARHPCLMDKRSGQGPAGPPMTVTEDCIGCMTCVSDVECPALIPDEDGKKVSIDRNTCTGCGLCVHACPADAIVSLEGGAL